MDKKEQIIKTAIKLFVKQGFENTPTSQISKDAKVATGTLFHYFKTKEELINEAYLYAKKDAIKVLSNLDEKKSVKEQIEYLWNIAIEWGQKNTIEMQFMNKYTHSVYITKNTVKKGKSIFEPFNKVFEKAKQQGILKDLPIEIIHGIFVAIYQSFLQAATSNKVMRKKSFEVLWDALKK